MQCMESLVLLPNPLTAQHASDIFPVLECGTHLSLSCFPYGFPASHASERSGLFLLEGFFLVMHD